MMYLIKFSILLFSMFLSFIESPALKLPDYMIPCSIEDPNLNECMLKNGKKAIQDLIKGDPRYGIPVLDPLLIEEMNINEFGSKVQIKKMVVSGLKDGDLQNISVNPDNRSVSVQYKAFKMNISGTVSFDGRVAALRFKHDADFESYLKDVLMVYRTTFQQLEKRNGTVYALPTDFDLDFIPDYMRFNVPNLFRGNKLLNDGMNRFFNENWREVMQDAGKTGTIGLATVLNEIITRAANKIPVSEVFT